MGVQMSKIKRFANDSMGEEKFEEFLDEQMEGASDGDEQ